MQMQVGMPVTMGMPQMQMQMMMHSPLQQMQQMMIGFGGFQEDQIINSMLMALGGDPFENMFNFSDSNLFLTKFIKTSMEEVYKVRLSVKVTLAQL